MIDPLADLLNDDTEVDSETTLVLEGGDKDHVVAIDDGSDDDGEIGEHQPAVEGGILAVQIQQTKKGGANTRKRQLASSNACGTQPRDANKK